MQLWNENDLGVYWSQGYTSIENLLDESTLTSIEEVIDSLILLEAEKTGVIDRFSGQSRDWRLHQGLISLPAENRRIVVDKINQSDFCRRVFGQEKLLELAKELTRSQRLSDIGMSNFFVRVDLPGQDKESMQRFSLPWHQDGGYYANKSCPETSAVMWFPLYDCFREEGCLEVCVGSHTRGLVEHDEFYILPEEKKHWRVEVPQDVVEGFDHRFAGCPRGAVNLFHMSLIHRSGYNSTQRVRYSFIIRASNLLSSTYVI